MQKPCYHGDRKPVSPSAVEDIQFLKLLFKKPYDEKGFFEGRHGGQAVGIWQIATCTIWGYQQFNSNHELTGNSTRMLKAEIYFSILNADAVYTMVGKYLIKNHCRCLS